MPCVAVPFREFRCMPGRSKNVCLCIIPTVKMYTNVPKCTEEPRRVQAKAEASQANGGKQKCGLAHSAPAARAAQIAKAEQEQRKAKQSKAKQR